MATLQRKEELIDVRIALVGTARAREKLWERLGELATLKRGEDQMIIRERTVHGRSIHGGGWPLRVTIERFVVEPHQNPIVKFVGQALHADAVFVALDLEGSSSERRRHIMKELDHSMAMLEPTGWQRPCAVVGFAEQHPSDPIPSEWEATKAWWEASAEDELSLQRFTCSMRSPFAEELLQAIGVCCRRSFRRRPPMINPLQPEVDLPEAMRANGVRFFNESKSHEFIPKTQGLMGLTALYRQAGHSTVARSLVRDVFAIPEARHVWGWRPKGKPPLPYYERLRRWEIPREKPVGVILLPPKDQALLVAAGPSLFKIYRGDPKETRLKTFDEPPLQIAPVDDQRFVGLWRGRLEVMKIDPFDSLASVEMPEALRERFKTLSRPELMPKGKVRHSMLQSVKSLGVRVRVSVEADRLLLVSRGGLWTFELSTLRPLKRLERPDLIDGYFVPGRLGEVWTVHDRGMIGRWMPGSTIVERVANFPRRVFDVSLAVGAGRAAALTETGATDGGPTVMLLDFASGESLGEYSTKGANTLRLSDDGERLLTIEDELLRIYDTSKPLSAATPVRSLLDPPPWLPMHVDWTKTGRYIAVLAQTPRGNAPLRVHYWG